MRDRPVPGDGALDVGPQGPPWVAGGMVVTFAVLWLAFAASFGSGRPDEFGRFIYEDLLLHPHAALSGLTLLQLPACAAFHNPNGLGHVGWNLALLFFLGSAVERSRGRMPMVLTAWLGAIVWAGVPLVAERIGLRTPLVVFGATGMVLALAPSALRAYGSEAVFIAGRVLPKRVLTWIAVAGTVIMHPRIATQDPFLVSMLAANLAALGVGFLVVRLIDRPVEETPPRTPTAPRPEPEVADVRERVDALLARIASDGIDALSDEERAFLETASKRYR